MAAQVENLMTMPAGTIKLLLEVTRLFSQGVKNEEVDLYRVTKELTDRLVETVEDIPEAADPEDEMPVMLTSEMLEYIPEVTMAFFESHASALAESTILSAKERESMMLECHRLEELDTRVDKALKPGPF